MMRQMECGTAVVSPERKSCKGMSGAEGRALD